MKKQKNSKSTTVTGQPRDEINVHPKEKNKLSEASGRSAVITFGRMNPPTVGHQLLVDKIVKTARSQRATPLIFLSHSSDPKKNPLSYEEKLRLAQAAFGRNIIVNSPARTIIEVLKTIQNRFDNVTVVVGSDRVSEFERIVKTYNGRDFKFKTINVISAGTRDPDAEGAQGMSASKMRELAKSNNASAFKRGLPKSLQSMSDMVIQMVRTGMNINEQFEEYLEAEELTEVLTLAQRRKKALTMKRYKSRLKVARQRQARRMADRARLTKRSRRASIKLIRKRLAGKKGAKYGSLSAAEKQVIDRRVQQRKTLVGKLAKRLLPAVRKAEIRRIGARRESFDVKFENYLNETEQVLNLNNLQEVTVIVDRFLEHLSSQTPIIEEKAMQHIIKKSEQTGISQDDLVEAYLEGKNNPRDGQTEDQSAFLNLNKYITEKKPGLWDNIHAKRRRIKAGSGERMRKPGSEGAPTKDDFERSAKNEAYRSRSIDYHQRRAAKHAELSHELRHEREPRRHSSSDAKNAYYRKMALKALDAAKKDPKGDFRKEDTTRHADKKRVKVKTPDGKVVWRDVKKEISVSEQYSKTVDSRQEKEKRNMEIRHARQDAAAKIRDVKSKKMNEAFVKELNRHGIPKDATKAELKKIRSNPNSSKGAKQLAHWKLNMHHND